MFRGEYRLSHWAGYRTVMGSDGEAMVFSHPLDAHKAATNEFLRLLNSRSEEHTSELQSLMRISYAVFCLKKKKKNTLNTHMRHTQSIMHNTQTKTTPVS